MLPDGISMRHLDFLYPVSVALDFVALASIVFSPILGFVSLIRCGWRQGRFTIAYLGYVCCAALVASFTAHFFLDGGDIYMMFSVWLMPFVVAATTALVMTLAIGRNGTLWTLALATTALGLAQAFAEQQVGGIGGGLARLMLVIYCAYAVLVLGLCAYRHDQWWRWRREQA